MECLNHIPPIKVWGYVEGVVCDCSKSVCIALKKKCPVHITRNVHLSQENCHRIHITFFSSRHIKSHYWSNACDSCYINHTPLKGTWLGVHNKLDPMVFCDFLNIFLFLKQRKSMMKQIGKKIWKGLGVGRGKRIW